MPYRALAALVLSLTPAALATDVHGSIVDDANQPAAGATVVYGRLAPHAPRNRAVATGPLLSARADA